MVTGFWLMFFIYFLPTLVAMARSNESVLVVLLVNLLFGFTIIGWVIALLMAISNTKKQIIVVERK